MKLGGYIFLENYDEEEWLENFRVTRSTFLYLCDRLRPSLEPEENILKPREPVSVEKQVALTLYFLSSCSEYRIVGNAFGLHKSTICKHIHRVVNAINKVLLPEYIRMPDSAECEEISNHCNEKYGIPRIIWAIDGSHIPILPPADGYRDFINRKGWPSLVLQGLVDHKLR